MEEVAFSAIPSIRQQWEFYSASSDSQGEASENKGKLLRMLKLELLKDHNGLAYRTAESSRDLAVARYRDAGLLTATTSAAPPKGLLSLGPLRIPPFQLAKSPETETARPLQRSRPTEQLEDENASSDDEPSPVSVTSHVS